MNEAQLLEYFNAADKDRSGQICAEELRQSLSNGTWKPFNLETVKLMINLFDRNNSGTIEFGEFKGLWKYISDWQQVFSSYDRNKKLTLTIDEVELALTNSGLRIPRQLLVMTLRKLQNTKDYADFDDFIHVSILLQKYSRVFAQLDSDRDGIVTINYEQFLRVMVDLL